MEEAQLKEAYKALESKGLNNTDNIVQWMKQSKLIPETPESQNSTKQLFNSVKDDQHVAFKEFIKVFSSIASDPKKVKRYSKELLKTFRKVQGSLSGDKDHSGKEIPESSNDENSIPENASEENSERPLESSGNENSIEEANTVENSANENSAEEAYSEDANTENSTEEITTAGSSGENS